MMMLLTVACLIFHQLIHPEILLEQGDFNAHAFSLAA